jgi:Holliday junction resolvase-like predicted endonuclease
MDMASRSEAAKKAWATMRARGTTPDAKQAGKKAWDTMRARGTTPDAKQAALKSWDLHGEEWGVGEEKAAEQLRKQGYEIVAHGKGIPDFLVAKSGKLAFFEIKTEDDKLKEHQSAVLRKLRELGFEARLWRYRRATDTFEES